MSARTATILIVLSLACASVSTLILANMVQTECRR